jgi:hypothetical protein
MVALGPFTRRRMWVLNVNKYHQSGTNMIVDILAALMVLNQNLIDFNIIVNYYF